MKNIENVGNHGVVFAALISVLKAMAATAAALLLLTLLVFYRGLSDSAASACVTAATFLCVFAAGLFTSRKMGRSGWLSGLVSGVLYVLAMLIFGYFVLGSFNVGADTIKMFIISVIAGITGGIAGVNLKKRKKYF